MLLCACTWVHLRLQARRTASFLDTLSSIQLGENEVSIREFVSAYERTDYRVEKAGATTYVVEVDPFLLRKPLKPDWLASAVSGLLLWSGDWRRRSGLRIWTADGMLEVKAGLVERSGASLAVEGENEWLMGTWDNRDAFPPDFMRIYRIPASQEGKKPSYFANWAHLHMGLETGEVFENHVTSSATAEQLRAAHDFNLACLTSRKGCHSLCELMPAATEYGRRHNSLSLGWNSGSWGRQDDESCH